MSLDRTLQRVWYHRSPLALFLLLTPLSLLFATISGLRRAAYRAGLFSSTRFTTPVIVVGNISVGGTGKTPLVIWIARFLEARGLRAAIVTRGYGGRSTCWPRDVDASSSASEVGDEAVLLSTRTRAIVVAGPDRVAAARRAIERGADIVISDDGLQHYRLRRDLEIVVIDAERGLGNGWRLPAGPLREGARRLQSVDLVVQTNRAQAATPYGDAQHVVAKHALQEAVCLVNGQRKSLREFTGATVHAVAGIGNPEAFFAMLRAQGLSVEEHALPDHATIERSQIEFPDTAPVLMTEKDAVKCRAFATARHWAVPLEVQFSSADERRLSEVLLAAIANVSPR